MPIKKLLNYHKKRDPARTPEPFTDTLNLKQLFVVQKHHASRLHYDFRLELEGTLKSWAVPKGPSLNPQDKRLAVHVEDHPLSYAYFEGVIPKGNYGAGNVIVWDIGYWQPLKDPIEGYKKGHLIFEVFGYKLRGRFALIKMKDGKAWLLIKEKDGFVSKKPWDNDRSIFSGLDVDERHREPKIEITKKLPKAPLLSAIQPMLATVYEKAFNDKHWLFEPKLDGFRLLAEKINDEVTLRYRHGQNATDAFPEIVAALKVWPYKQFILDGEIVVLNNDGAPSFQLLQQRFQLRDRESIAKASVYQPISFFVFDLLALQNKDLRSLPLIQRKKYLSQITPGLGPVREVEYVVAVGEKLFETVQKLHLEGIVGKKIDSTYVSKRSDDWRKIRHDKTEDFVIVGFTYARNSKRLGALMLAQYGEDKTLHYSGKVGTGLPQQLTATLEKLKIKRDSCKDVPFTDYFPVKPTLVCEVFFKERTEDNLLRIARFSRQRTDKKPEECLRQTFLPEQATPPKIKFKNLEKIFWPKEGYTKGDLIHYYEKISPWLLPYLKDRPLILTRYPDGILGKSFFQRNVPVGLENKISSQMLQDEKGQSIATFVCNDVHSLLYLIQLGTIPLHISASRFAKINYPDWCVIDLDPKDAPFKHVITLAKAIHELCEELNLKSYVKTTGKTGLHVMIAMQAKYTHEEIKKQAEMLAKIIVAKHPTIATMERLIKKRQNKVYIDIGQNGLLRLMASPFCVRPVEGALVSMPLLWSEVNAKLDPKKFTLKNALKRMQFLKQDPLLAVLR